MAGLNHVLCYTTIYDPALFPCQNDVAVVIEFKPRHYFSDNYKTVHPSSLHISTAHLSCQQIQQVIVWCRVKFQTYFIIIDAASLS